LLGLLHRIFALFRIQEPDLTQPKETAGLPTASYNPPGLTIINS